MDTNRLLDAGELGTHLLFDRRSIQEAFSNEAEDLRGIVAARLEEIQAAVESVVAIPELGAARRFVASLPATTTEKFALGNARSDIKFVYGGTTFFSDTFRLSVIDQVTA